MFATRGVSSRALISCSHRPWHASQAFTTVVYHGAMFGELRSRFDDGATGAAGGLTGAPGSYSSACLQGAGVQRLSAPLQTNPGSGQPGLAAQALAMIDGLPSLA